MIDNDGIMLLPGPSSRGFAVGLYLEHLEEASFLYEQRLALLDDPELSWADLHDFEERFEAHLDALVLGDDLALAVCRQQALEGDFGELHTVVRVFCRQDRPDLFEEVAEQLDTDDDDRVKATANALCHELPQSWHPMLKAKLTERDRTFTLLTARALGYRRIPASDALIEALAYVQESALADVIWSLGRLCDPRARSLIYKTYLQRASEDIQAAAAVALLRMGEPAAVQYCAGVARTQPWALLPLGLGGNTAHRGLLIEIASSEAVSANCLIALGLLGEPAAVDPLLYHLGDESLAEEASLALYMITGAELFEEVFVPEEIEENELFADEIADINEARAKEAGSHESEEPRGTTLTRLTQEPDVWREWWEQNKSSFRAGMRYRYGGAYSPERLLAIIAAEQSPNLVRRLAAEELTIRYGCDIPFETDMSVSEQVEAIRSAAGWLESRASHFAEGAYYLAGKPKTR